MGRLAVILGSSATGPAGGGVAAAAERHEVVVLQRHGSDSAYVLPHRIDHVANLRSLAAEGCDRVLSICSVGSLRAGLAVGSLVCPHDFIALQTTVTSFGDSRGHATPGFDPSWREEVLAAWRESGAGDLRDRGVYWQTNGPRFETAAEVRLIAAHADLVGMTLASECVVAGELGLRCAAVCIVDNLANGIGAEPLSPTEVERHREANAVRLRDAFDAVLPELAGRAAC
jgi:5'-methylthioinosine phosphorylase